MRLFKRVVEDGSGKVRIRKEGMEGIVPARGIGLRPSAPRILLVLTELPPAEGGMQTHARHLALHLARRGAAIEVRITDPAHAAQARVFNDNCGYPVRRVHRLARRAREEFDWSSVMGRRERALEQAISAP